MVDDVNLLHDHDDDDDSDVDDDDEFDDDGDVGDGLRLFSFTDQLLKSP